jgi:hypothetical protein
MSKPDLPHKNVELLPSDSYKGKSVAELEAILDAHNKSMAAPVEYPVEEVKTKR